MQEEFDQACENGDTETVKRLLTDNTVDPAAGLRCASLHGRVEVVRLLLADGRADPAAKKNAAICYASIRGHLEIVSLLLKRVDPTSNDNEAIHLASEYRHVEVVKLLLTDKRVNPKGEDGIRLKFIYTCEFMDIVVFDDVLCRVKNEDINSIKNPDIREKYIKWLYRIGGEKWSQARNTVEN